MTIDILFALDILIIFNTAFYNDDVDLVENRKDIAQSYIKGWFWIDLISIIPFNLII